MNPSSDAQAKEIPPPEMELEYGDEVLSAGWNPDIERLAKARERQPEDSGDKPKRR